MKKANARLFHMTAIVALALGIGQADAAALRVTNGWFRALPAAVPSGGYFTLHNDGDKAVSLTGAQSPACGMLMLHKSMNHGGIRTLEETTDWSDDSLLSLPQFGPSYLIAIRALVARQQQKEH